MSRVLYLGVFASMFAGQAVFAGDASIFGYPLGGKISPPVKQCPSNSDKSKVICWIEKPRIAKDGVRSGHLHLPNPDSRPSWAAFVGFQAEISNSGILEVLHVRTNKGYADKIDIQNSITSRFGLPESTNIFNRGTVSATWDTNEAYIHMICNDDKECFVEFRSLYSQKERIKAHAAQDLIESKRPKF